MNRIETECTYCFAIVQGETLPWLDATLWHNRPLLSTHARDVGPSFVAVRELTRGFEVRVMVKGCQPSMREALIR